VQETTEPTRVTGKLNEYAKLAGQWDKFKKKEEWFQQLEARLKMYEPESEGIKVDLENIIFNRQKEEFAPTIRLALKVLLKDFQDPRTTEHPSVVKQLNSD
jgi:hypothetical protein